MASLFPNGSVFAMAQTYGTAIPVVSVSNANPAVATVSGTPPAENDIMVVRTGWGAVNDSVVKAGAVTADTVVLLGVDSTNEQRFPPDGSAGTIIVASNWVSLNQITDVATSGGEQQFYQWQYLEEDAQRQRPTFKNARSMTITADYDPLLPWHQPLLDADWTREQFVFRLSLPNGDQIFYNMYPSYDGEPSLTINENMQVTLTLAYANPRSRRYAA